MRSSSALSWPKTRPVPFPRTAPASISSGYGFRSSPCHPSRSRTTSPTPWAITPRCSPSSRSVFSARGANRCTSPGATSTRTPWRISSTSIARRPCTPRGVPPPRRRSIARRGELAGIGQRTLSSRGRGFREAAGYSAATMSLYPMVLEMKKLLGNMGGWLDKAESHASAKGYDPNTLLQARLAPDMFPLVRQFQNACDNAKFAAAFSPGKEPPSHPDTEQTFAEVRARLTKVIDYLGTFSAKDFEGTDARSVSRPRWEGRSLSGTDYFLEQA